MRRTITGAVVAGIATFALAVPGVTPALAASPLQWGPAQTLPLPYPGLWNVQLTCESKAFCLATGTDEFYRAAPWALTGTDLTSASPAWSPSGGTGTGTSLNPDIPVQAGYCSSPTFCVTVGSSGGTESYGFSSNAAAVSPTWTTAQAYPSGDAQPGSLSAVTCVGTSLCLAVDNQGDILTTADPSTGQPWTVQAAGTPTTQFQAIACTPSGACLAVDTQGDLYSDPDTLHDPAAWSQATIDPGNSLTSVACPSDSLCLATDASGNLLTSSDPTGGAGTWTSAAIDPGNEIAQISCASALLCVFVDSQGNAFSSPTPAVTTPASWSAQPISTTGLATVSCGSDDTCVASTSGDSQGEYFVGTTTSVGAPTVSVNPPTGPVASTSVTLTGTVNPNDDAVTACQFAWGTSATSPTATTSCSPDQIGSGTSPVSVSGTLTGLTPGTTYYFDLTATNSHGTSTSGVGETFVTSGGAQPSTEALGSDGGYGSSTATLSADVNPHNAPTTYRFVWGTSPESAPGQYPFSTAPQTIDAGTTAVPISTAIGGIQNDRTYYFRVVASNALGTTVSGEAHWSTYAPPPSEISPPYLQDSGGYDADAGYTLRCNPGAWSLTDDHYRIRWVYVSSRTGVVRPALDHTGTSLNQGDLYYVARADIGQTLACEVQAYSLDGATVWPMAPILSDAIVPEGPQQAAIPAWLKFVFNHALGGFSATGILGVARTCVEFADVPELGEAVCIGAITLYVSESVFNDYIKHVVDPPDRAFRQIALPPRPLTATLQLRCPGHLRSHACALLRRSAGGFARAQAEVAATMRLLYVTANRFLIAREHNLSTLQFIQQAAIKVDMGFAAAALRSLARAATHYARRLRTDRVREVGARAGRMTVSQLLRSPAMRLLARSGISRAQARSALVRLVRATARQRRVSVSDLARTQSSAPLEREYRTLTFADAEAIVAGLVSQHAMRAATARAAYTQLDAAQAACTTAARQAALRQLLRAANGGTRGGYRSFLHAATTVLNHP
ncbi:MAG: hypothetical protein ACYC0H_08535, partial [Solirubrobacteraceae bacterium]